MTRAGQACRHAGCPNLMPCPDHKPKPWSRGKRLRSQFAASGSKQARRKRYVLYRDQGICYVCGLSGADQADHVIPLGEGGVDDVSNMGAIHAKPCHAAKTQQEARRGEARALDNLARVSGGVLGKRG